MVVCKKWPKYYKLKTAKFVDKDSQQQMYAKLAAVDRDHSQERKEFSPAGLFFYKAEDQHQ